MRRATTVALLALAALSAKAETPLVQVRTTDEREFRGEVDLAGLKIRTAKATVSFPAEYVAEILFEPAESVLTLLDGRQYHGKVQVDEWKLRTALGDLRLKSDGLKSLRVIPPGNAASKTANRLEEAASRHFGICIAGRPSFSASGETLVFINATDSTLTQVSRKDLSLRAPVNLPEGCLALAVTPKGNIAAVASGTSITIVDLERGEVVKTFEVEHPVSDLLALDGETLVASSDEGLLVVSVSRQSVVRRVQAEGGAFLAAPGRRKVYGSRFTFELPEIPPYRSEDFLPVPCPLERDFRPDRFTISPDGRLAVGVDGAVLRTASSDRAELAPCGMIAKHLASAVLPGARRLFAFTADGDALEYELPSLELKAGRKLTRRVLMAMPDESRRAIFAWAIPADTKAPEPAQRVTPMGDLVILPYPE